MPIPLRDAGPTRVGTGDSVPPENAEGHSPPPKIYFVFIDGGLGRKILPSITPSRFGEPIAGD